ncbi:unnamed protein product [Effrenium voratum]|nr:unnamed protein product [Effrenium voratum]
MGSAASASPADSEVALLRSAAQRGLQDEDAWPELQALALRLKLPQALGEARAKLGQQLLAILEEAPQNLPLAPLANLWAQNFAPLRLSLLAHGRNRKEWLDAQESAYFAHFGSSLISPRPLLLRALQLQHLEDLFKLRARYLQEPVFHPELGCYLRPSCQQFYDQVLAPVTVGVFADLYPPHRAEVYVSHCLCQAYEDLHLALTRHGASRCDRDVAYWLRLFAADGDADAVGAVGAVPRFLVAWDPGGMWPTRAHCLSELSAHDFRKPTEVVSTEGPLGGVLAGASRAAAWRLWAAAGGKAAGPAGALRRLAGRLLVLGDTQGPRLVKEASPSCALLGDSSELQFRSRCEVLRECFMPGVLVIQARPGHGRNLLARQLLSFAEVPVPINCAVLAQRMADQALSSKDDLLGAWLTEMGETLPPQAQVVVFLDSLERAGQQVPQICAWARRFGSAEPADPAEGGRGLVVTLREEERAGEHEDHLLSSDFTDLSWSKRAWEELSKCSKVQKCRITSSGARLLLDTSSIAPAEHLALGRPLTATLAAGQVCQADCEAMRKAFEDLKNAAELQGLALEMCYADLHVVPKGRVRGPHAVLHPLGEWRRFSHSSMRSFLAAQELLRRRDLPPQVLSRQWPQVRRFLERALEDEVVKSCASELVDVVVLRQHVEMAQLLGVDLRLLHLLLDAAGASEPARELAELAASALQAALVRVLSSQASSPLAELLALGGRALRLEHLDGSRAELEASLRKARAALRLEALEAAALDAGAVLTCLQQTKSDGRLGPRRWALAASFLKRRSKGGVSLLQLAELMAVAAAAELPRDFVADLISDAFSSAPPVTSAWLKTAAALTESPAIAALAKSFQAPRFAQLQRCLAEGAAEGLPQRFLEEVEVASARRRLAAGRYHSVVLADDGAVAFGLNGAGESLLPKLPEGVRYVAVAAGVQHTVLLRSDGTVACCGLNLDGQASAPQTFPPGRRVAAVAAGGFHSILMDDTGCCCGFGCNSYGQAELSPVPCISVAAGLFHTVRVLHDGTAQCVGLNSHGQCEAPTLWGDQRYVLAAAGGRHSVLLRQDGQALAFGCNAHGQCDVPPLPAALRYLDVACGECHTVLLRSDGVALALGQSSPPKGRFAPWIRRVGV